MPRSAAGRPSTSRFWRRSRRSATTFWARNRWSGRPRRRKRTDRHSACRGHGCGSVRLLQHHSESTSGLSGQAARVPQRQPCRAQGLRERAEGEEQRRDRGRVDAPDRRARGRSVRVARPLARGERPAGHLHRLVRSRRSAGSGARYAAPCSADDRTRSASADLTAAAHARDRHAQPVLVRRLPVLEARVRRQEQGGAEGASTGTRVSATSSGRS